MDGEIIKICKRCGPLTIDHIRRRKTRKEIVCLACERISQKLKRTKFKDKYLEKARELRNFKRDPATISMYCSGCKQEKLVKHFNMFMLHIKYPYCRECRIRATKKSHHKEERKLKHRKWYQENYEPIAENSRLQKQFGITLSCYENLLVQQKHSCKICNRHSSEFLTKSGKPRKLHVDHDHSTGSIRGLLCFPCNIALGYFQDNPDFLRSALCYLNSFSISGKKSLLV